MNRISVIFVVFLLTLISVLGGVIYLRGDVLIKYLIKAYDQSSCQCQLQIDKVVWTVKDPMKVSIINFSSDMGGIDFSIGKLNLVIKPIFLMSQFDFKLKVDLKLDKVKAGYNAGLVGEAGSTSVMNKSSRQLARQIEGLKHLTVAMTVTDFELKSKHKNNQNYLYKFSKIKNEFDGSHFTLKWDFAGDITPPKEIFNKPIVIASQGSIVKGPEKIEFIKTVLKVMGVPIELLGGLVIESNAADVNAKISKLNLSEINAELVNSPITNLGGFISLDTHITRAASLDPWSLEGKLAVEGVSGNVNVTGEQYLVQGPVKLNLIAEGKYHVDNGLELPKVDWLLDLTDSKFQWGSILAKPPQVKLSSEGTVQYGRGVTLKSTSVHLGDLAILVDGLIDNSNLADLNFKVNPLNLLGMEKIFPFLSDYPLVGQAELVGQYKGNLMKPEKANLILEKVSFENIKGKLSWQSNETKLSGPFQFNLKGFLNVVGKEVRKGDLDLKMDLTGMDVQIGAWFRKSVQSLFDLRIVAVQDKGALKVKQGSLKGPFGVFGIEGIFPVPPIYSMNLTVASTQINLAPLKSWFVGTGNLIPDGQIKGNLSMSGELNTSDLANSRIFSKGDLKAIIPSLILPSRDKESDLKMPSDKQYLPDPILSSTQLLQAMTLNLDVMLGNIQWKKMTLANVHLVSEIAEGRARGQSRIAKVLGGSVEFPLFDIPLFEFNPGVTFNIKASHINVARILEDFFPPWKDLLQGSMSGEFVGLTKLPTSSTFLHDFQSSGNFKITQASLRGVPLKSGLESRVSNLKVGNGIFRNFTFQNTNLAIKSEFALAKQKINFKPMVLLTPEGHELSIEGEVGLDKTADLHGQLMIAKLKSNGSFFEANRASDGRLFLPLMIQGNLSQPEVQIVSGAVSEMLEKKAHFDRTRGIATEQIGIKKDSNSH